VAAVSARELLEDAVARLAAIVVSFEAGDRELAYALLVDWELELERELGELPEAA
jgi:hypothetical protein